MKITVSCTLCSVVEIDQRLRGAYCLCYQSCETSISLVKNRFKSGLSSRYILSIRTTLETGAFIIGTNHLKLNLV
jgi:hypothetical protein